MNTLKDDLTLTKNIVIFIYNYITIVYILTIGYIFTNSNFKNYSCIAQNSSKNNY